MVIIISQHTLACDAVKKEVDIAKDNKLHIIGFWLGKIEHNNFNINKNIFWYEGIDLVIKHSKDRLKSKIFPYVQILVPILGLLVAIYATFFKPPTHQLLYQKQTPISSPKSLNEIETISVERKKPGRPIASITATSSPTPIIAAPSKGGNGVSVGGNNSGIIGDSNTVIINNPTQAPHATTKPTPTPTPRCALNAGDTNIKEIPQMIYIKSTKNLKAFCISKHEITFAQYGAYCNINSLKTPSSNGLPHTTYPVFNVSYVESTNYANWLGTITNRRCRLPRLEEWQYVCNPDGGKYPWGDSDDRTTVRKYANFSLNSKDGPATVGRYSPTKTGVYDIVSNLWEWIEDPANRSEEDHIYDRHIMVGGAYDSGLTYLSCRSSYKERGDQSDHIGFRVVCE